MLNSHAILPLFILMAVAQALDCVGQALPDRLDVQVEVKAIRNQKGNIRCILWRSAEGFPRDVTRGFQRKEAEIQAGRATLSFTEVPAGQYAVSCIHDENRNKDFDSNFMGIPKEGYGFSNNARGRLGPPSFSDASFAVRPEDKPVREVTLKY